MMDKSATQHWSVTVECNGQQVLTINNEFVQTHELSAENELIIMRCAHHLLDAGMAMAMRAARVNTDSPDTEVL
jgi:hypothetical protein